MRRATAIVFFCLTLVATGAATNAMLAEGTVSTPIHMLDVGPDGYLELDVERVSSADFIVVEVRTDVHGELRAKLLEGNRWVLNLLGADRARVTVACPDEVTRCEYRLRDESTNRASDLDPDRATMVYTGPVPPTTTTTTTTTAPAPTPTTVDEPSSPAAPSPGSNVLLVSTRSDRANPAPLDEATVSGDIYVFADLPSSEAPVRFFLDGSRIQTERYLPFDARGGRASAAQPLDTTELADGQHTLRIVSDNEDVTATFIVANERPPAATSVDPTTTTTEAVVAPQAPPTTVAAPTSTTTTTVASAASSSEPSKGSTRLVIDRDTTVVNGLVLRAGDSIEFRNGARLIFANGGYADWQGTPTWTWSDDGRRMNLERDIEIFGEGHVMFHAGSAPSTIRFVEFDLQPRRELGHYPLHWHLAGDSSRGTLVEGTVVKHSTNRAYVPHGSHGITFRDTIAYDIEGSAYWWDPPVFQGGPDENNSDDIVYERALAHTVTNHWSDDRGFRLAAFTMAAGRNNVVRDSVARNVEPSHVKDCAGFGWPELSHVQERVWTFTDNATFESDCHGTFVWQNGKEVTHVVDGFRGDAISHGAYVNDYVYRDVDVTGVVVHAVGWRVEGGRVGDVVATRSQFEGTVVFDGVTVDSLTIDNGANGGVQSVEYVFSNTKGISCSDVVWKRWTPGTKVVLNGSTCSP